MNFTKAHLDALAREAPRSKRAPKRPSLDRLASKLRSTVRQGHTREIQRCLILLDESVRFFVHFERFYNTCELTAETSPFAFQLLRIRSDILAIRELVTLGLESPALTLGRAFVENVELAMALVEDPQFALEFSESSDDADFWKSHIGYGRIYPRVERFILSAGFSPDATAERLSHHRAVKTFLAGHAHPSYGAAFTVAFPASIRNPGLFHNRPLGALTTNLVRECLFLAAETHNFVVCCINLFVRPKPPLAFADFKPNGEMDDFMGSAHVLQELLISHEDALYVYLDDLEEQHLRASLEEA